MTRTHRQAAVALVTAAALNLSTTGLVRADPVPGLSAEITQASPGTVGPLPAASVSDLVRGVDIPYQMFTLDNGLTVIVHTDRRAPQVTICPSSEHSAQLAA